MSAFFTLYTVHSERDVYYAAVESETGRVWTAPNKEGAVQQARQAGLTRYVEKAITRHDLPRVLGFDRPHLHRPPREESPAHPAAPAPPPRGSPAAWFVPGDGSAVERPADVRFPQTPAPLRKGAAARQKKSASPFAARSEIPIPSSSATDDAGPLILPRPAAPLSQNPFSDQPAARVEDPPENR